MNMVHYWLYMHSCAKENSKIFETQTKENLSKFDGKSFNFLARKFYYFADERTQLLDVQQKHQ